MQPNIVQRVDKGYKQEIKNTGDESDEFEVGTITRQSKHAKDQPKYQKKVKPENKPENKKQHNNQDELSSKEQNYQRGRGRGDRPDRGSDSVRGTRGQQTARGGRG